MAWRILSNLFSQSQLLLLKEYFSSAATAILSIPERRYCTCDKVLVAPSVFNTTADRLTGAKRCFTLISYEPHSSLFPLSCYCYLTNMSTNNQSILLSALYRPTLISYQRWYDTYLIWKSSNFISIYLEGGCSLWFQLYCVG